MGNFLTVSIIFFEEVDNKWKSTEINFPQNITKKTFEIS